MLKSISIALLLGASSAFASSSSNIIAKITTMGAKTLQVATHAEFNVGDTCSYSLDTSDGNGTMTMTVTSVTSTQLVMDQKIVILGENQDCQSTTDLSTGQVTAMTCNGQAQTVPDQTFTVDSTDQEQCSVPAGNYACTHIVGHDSKNEQIENWQDTTDIPLSGLLKSIQPSQIGNITVELTSFARGTAN